MITLIISKVCPGDDSRQDSQPFFRFGHYSLHPLMFTILIIANDILHLISKLIFDKDIKILYNIINKVARSL